MYTQYKYYRERDVMFFASTGVSQGRSQSIPPSTEHHSPNRRCEESVWIIGRLLRNGTVAAQLAVSQIRQQYV